MPYVNEVVKKNMAPFIEDLIQFLEHENTVIQPGEFTYIIYRLMLAHREGLRAMIGDHKYSSLAEILGCVESAKLEFYRRIVAPFEDLKITENGDV